MPICVETRLAAREFGEQARLAQVVAQGLLHVDGLAVLHRLDRHQAVHVIGRRDVDRIDLLVLLLQHLAPVLVDADLRKALVELLEAAQVDVGDGDQIERRVLGERR